MRERGLVAGVVSERASLVVLCIFILVKSTAAGNSLELLWLNKSV